MDISKSNVLSSQREERSEFKVGDLIRMKPHSRSSNIYNAYSNVVRTMIHSREYGVIIVINKHNKLADILVGGHLCYAFMFDMEFAFPEEVKNPGSV